MRRKPKPFKLNPVLEKAAQRAMKLPNQELIEWFDLTTIEVGQAFDQWRKGYPLEEVTLSVGVLGVLMEEIRSRTWQ